jgi:hypothetical protein
MLRTISVSSCISVQGIEVARLSDGKVVVRVDEKDFVGFPVVPMRRIALHPLQD